MNDFFSAWKSQIYDVSKGKYWTHTDGTKWWHNPDTDKIEPYVATSETRIEDIKTIDPKDATKLVGLDNIVISRAVAVARELVSGVASGLGKDVASAQAENTLAGILDSESNKAILLQQYTAFSEMGLYSCAALVSSRITQLKNANPSTPSTGATHDHQGAGGSRSLLTIDGKSATYEVIGKDTENNNIIRVYSDDGKKHRDYVEKQFGGNSAAASNEQLANTLYDMFRTSLSHSKYGKHSSLRLLYNESKLCKFSDGGVSLLRPFAGEATRIADIKDTRQAYEAKLLIQNNFVLDAWLSDWSITDGDSFGVVKGSVKRLKSSAALAFRSNGDLKGSAFGDKVTELDTMRDANVSAESAKYFGDIPLIDIVRQINEFKDNIVSRGASWLYDQAVRSGYSDKEATSITRKLLARANYIIKYGESVKKKALDTSQNTVFETYEDLAKLSTETYAMLSDDERSAIYEYTTSGFEDINQTVYKGKMPKVAKDLDKALSKMPKYKGVSVRRVYKYQHNEEHFGRWESGDWSSCVWKAFSSTSIKNGRFLSSGVSGMSFVVLNKGIGGGFLGGDDVSPYSDDESELLVRPGAKYRVTGTCRGSDKGSVFNKCVILEELSEDEYNSLPESQEPPKKWEYNELLTYLKSSNLNI